jgi:hypothetical protein
VDLGSEDGCDREIWRRCRAWLMGIVCVRAKVLCGVVCMTNGGGYNLSGSLTQFWIRTGPLGYHIRIFRLLLPLRMEWRPVSAGACRERLAAVLDSYCGRALGHGYKP